MKQRIIYEPIEAWLKAKGFKVLVAGEKTRIVISFSDIAPAIYKIPDLIGVSENDRVAVVEVEQDKRLFFDALGRCMLWKTAATFVYLAYPKDVISNARLLSRLGIGFLEWHSHSHAIDETGPLPERDPELLAVWELHPMDFMREQELARLIRNTPG
jgi:hypothetical protein